MVNTKLKNIILKIESGSRPKGGIKNNKGTIPSLGAEHLMESGGINIDKMKFIDSEFFKKMNTGKLEKKDILIVKDGATTGKVCFIDDNFPYNKASINEHVFKLKIDENKSYSKFIYWYLKSDKGYRQILSDFRGATVGGISRLFVDKVILPLPPFSEQKRIAETLDKVDNLRQKRKLSIQLLDDYIKSVFYDMFNGNKYPSVELNNLTEKITDGVHLRPSYTVNGIPFISVKDITTKTLIFDSCKYISKEDHEKFTKRCKPEYNDILYTKVGATYGRACIIDTKKEFSIYVSVCLIKPKKEIINSEYLKYIMNCDIVKRQADKCIKGIGVPDLHLIEIQNFIIPVPPIKLQNKFAQIVQQVEQTKSKMEESLKEIENLFNSLMQKYFAN